MLGPRDPPCAGYAPIDVDQIAQGYSNGRKVLGTQLTGGASAGSNAWRWRADGLPLTQGIRSGG